MTNISSKILTALPSSVNDALKRVIEHKKSFKCYIVGGVARDLLLGREIFDVDITVEGDAVEFAGILETKNEAKIVQTQPELRTAKLKFKNGAEIDFASTRTEAYPKKGHLPVPVKIGCPLEEDVKRRDFTVNTLAASLNEEDFGEIRDFTGGREDLEKKQLRILHKASFIDDPTRIIRGLKFSVRFDFELEPETRTLQDEYLNNPNADISYSRLKSELMQAFSLPYPEVWKKFIEQNIFRLINKDFKSEINADKAFSLIKKYKPANQWLFWLAPVFIGSKTLDLMNFTREEKKIITDLEKILNSTPQQNSNLGIYKFFNGIEKEAVLGYYLLTNQHFALDFLDNLAEIRLQITGEDIKKAGMPPSSIYNEIFDAILEEKLSGNLCSREDELDFLKFLIKELKK